MKPPLDVKPPWQEEILQRWRIRHVAMEALRPGDHLWTSRCARTKDLPEGTPRDLYRSDLLEEFYGFTERNGLRYGIVSDRYGLHLDDEVLPYYDVHPSMLSGADKRDLGAVVKRKTLAAGYGSIVFFAHSPLMSRPYFEILDHAEINVFFVTTLRSQDRCRKR